MRSKTTEYDDFAVYDDLAVGSSDLGLWVLLQDHRSEGDAQQVLAELRAVPEAFDDGVAPPVH